MEADGPDPHQHGARGQTRLLRRHVPRLRVSQVEQHQRQRQLLSGSRQFAVPHARDHVRVHLYGRAGPWRHLGEAVHGLPGRAVRLQLPARARVRQQRHGVRGRVARVRRLSQRGLHRRAVSLARQLGVLVLEQQVDPGGLGLRVAAQTLGHGRPGVGRHQPRRHHVLGRGARPHGAG